MFAIIACIFLGFFCGNGVVCTATDFSLQFPQKRTTDFANIWGMRSLTQFTVCFWINSTVAKGTPFSYASSDHYNDLLIDADKHSTGFDLSIGDSKVAMGVTANDGDWHQICATWRNSDGVWTSYKDGALVQTGAGHQTGYTIKADGSLVLGQEQDTVGGGFDPDQSFVGTITNVNVWSYVLPDITIKELSASCQAGEGDVYKWADFSHGIKGNTRVVIPPGCQ